MPGHPSAPVFAALVPIAEDLGLDGESFLRAAICGLEAALRIADAAKPDHYERGWHATATIGLAVSRVAGVKSMFGTMTKPAQAGMAAHPDSLENPQELLPLYSAWDGSWTSWSDRPFVLLDILFKYHAACYFTHAGIDAAMQVRKRAAGASIRQLRLRANPQNLSVCDIRRPTSGLEAKLSMTATSGMGLLGVDIGAPESFTDDAARKSDLTALIERTSVEPDPGLKRTQMVVMAELDSGETMRAEADSGRRERDLPHQRDRLDAKCRRLVGDTLTDDAAEALIDEVRRTRELTDVRALVATVTSQPG